MATTPARVSLTVTLPPHCRRLARVTGPVTVGVAADDRVTVGMVFDAIETSYPMLRGLLREHGGPLRPFIRIFAAGEDLTSRGLAAEIPPTVLTGMEPLLIIGAIAGG